MKKLLIGLAMVGVLVGFSPTVKAMEVQPSQQELTQQLIVLLTNMIAELQRQINEILAREALQSIQPTQPPQIVQNDPIPSGTAPIVVTPPVIAPVAPAVVLPIVITPIKGCTDSSADNYNSSATVNEGCFFSPSINTQLMFGNATSSNNKELSRLTLTSNSHGDLNINSQNPLKIQLSHASSVSNLPGIVKLFLNGIDIQHITCLNLQCTFNLPDTTVKNANMMTYSLYADVSGVLVDYDSNILPTVSTSVEYKGMSHSTGVRVQ